MGTYFSISISAVENTVDVDNNRSYVTVNLQCNCSGGYASDNPEYWIKVNGNTVASGIRNFDHENFTISWSGYISHNEDGTGSFTYQGYFQGTDKPSGDTTAVYTKTLTKINVGGTGLKVWLPLNGDLHNQGLSGNITYSLVDGNSWTTPGKIGSHSLKLTKLQQILPNNSCMTNAKELTWSYWVKVDTAWSANWLDGIRWTSTDGSSTHTSRQEFYTNCTYCGIWYKDGSISGKVFTPGVWTHFAATLNYNTGVAKFYINGVLSGTTTNVTTTHRCRGDFYIGDNGTDISFNDLRIYNIVLSAEEIHELSKCLVCHYKLDGFSNVQPTIGVAGQKVVDSSGYSNNGTIYDSLTVMQGSARHESSTLFNGTLACIGVDYNNICPDNIYTFSLWFKKDSLGTKNYETLFGGPSGYEMDTRANTAQTLSLYMASVRGGSIAGTSGLSFGDWHHVVASRDGTNEKYYVDGVLKATITAKSMPTGQYFIGAWKTSNSQNYYGYISDFRIYNTVLSDDDVRQLYEVRAKVDNGQNMYSFDFVESNSLQLSTEGLMYESELVEGSKALIYEDGEIKAREFIEL